MDALPRARHFYDVNLRPKSFTPELVLELLGRATVVKLNQDEVRSLDVMFQKKQSYAGGVLPRSRGAFRLGSGVRYSR